MGKKEFCFAMMSREEAVNEVVQVLAAREHETGEGACRARLAVLQEALPGCRDWFAERGYAEADAMYAEVQRDLKSWVDRHQKEYGYLGLTARIAEWISFYVKGVLVPVGRFQIQFPMQWCYDANGVFQPGDPVVYLHIPAWKGALTPESCRESFVQIREFLKKYHSDYPYRGLVVESWLLDPFFSRVLPEGNMAKFARFGHPFPLAVDQTDEAIWRVFGIGGIASVLQPNRLQSALKEHYEKGGKISEWGWYLTRAEIERGEWCVPNRKFDR